MDLLPRVFSILFREKHYTQYILLHFPLVLEGVLKSEGIFSRRKLQFWKQNRHEKYVQCRYGSISINVAS